MCRSFQARSLSVDANLFANKLALCVSDSLRPRFSTDAYNSYRTALAQAFGRSVDHGMLVKQYGTPSKSEQRRYSPASIIGVKEYQNSGQSEPGQNCTLPIEQSKLTVRMQNRQFTG
jgi:hypothetical protein